MYIGLRGLSLRFRGVGFRLLQLPQGITTTCPEASDDTQESGDIRDTDQKSSQTIAKHPALVHSRFRVRRLSLRVWTMGSLEVLPRLWV